MSVVLPFIIPDGEPSAPLCSGIIARGYLPVDGGGKGGEGVGELTNVSVRPKNGLDRRRRRVLAILPGEGEGRA